MMDIWNKLKSVPADSLKTIQAGRLKGKSDINPQWRYQVLTETFGVCGIGWKYTIDKQWIEPYQNGEIAAFVNISLYIKQNGEWSEAIPANGGSMFVANERNGAFVSDECFKMACTDALGTAAKMLGVGADVYKGLQDSKYSAPAPQSTPLTEDNRPWLNENTDEYNRIKAALAKVEDKAGALKAFETRFKISKQTKDKLIS
jgi:hypothetical protein